MELNKTNNAVFTLNYHLIVCTKYRQKVFVEEDIINKTKELIEKTAKTFDVKIIEQECGEDHIHIVFSSKPSLDLTKFINCLKAHSSRDLRKNYKDFLSDKLWGEHFWSPSYFIATTGNVSLDILMEYVTNQRTL